MKKALITGVGGQDGSLLAEHLVKLGYEVHGIARGLTYENLPIPGVTVHVGDMRDKVTLENIFQKVWPDEVYNLAGQVFIPTSWTEPEETFDINVGGLTRLLNIVWDMKRDTKIYQASSSEMYGNQTGALNEESPMRPVSPYGTSKYAAHLLCGIYRKRGLYAVAGILFNHEGPRRGTHMVTRKITRHVARWVCGDRAPLELGNMDAARDWGNAADYVVAMHRMLQQDEPDDYVIGTGVCHTVKGFLLAAVAAADMDWQKMKPLVRTTKAFARSNELWYLEADYSKAKRMLGWEPTTSFEQLVKLMVDHDVAELKGRQERGIGAELEPVRHFESV
jgi:GDPmannose 4,6-dehydratase